VLLFVSVLGGIESVWFAGIVAGAAIMAASDGVFVYIGTSGELEEVERVKVARWETAASHAAHVASIGYP